jgi:uncharacterized membrane protein YhdT
MKKEVIVALCVFIVSLILIFVPEYSPHAHEAQRELKVWMIFSCIMSVVFIGLSYPWKRKDKPKQEIKF